jgi:hypothetical protein
MVWGRSSSGSRVLGEYRTVFDPAKFGCQVALCRAGPRLAYRNRSRYEPWAHLTVGLDHFRFSQTAGLLGSNNAIAGAAGGGVDVYLKSHTAFRIEVDAVGSRFFSTNQRSFQVAGGLVLGF